MSIPDLNEYTRVAEAHVLVEYAQDDAGSPGAFASVGCLKGDLTVSNAVEERTDDIQNWCTVGAAAVLATATPGDSTRTISGTLEILLGDAGWANVKADADDGATGYFRVTWSNGATPTPDSLVETFEGFFTQFDMVARQEGTSDTPFTFRVNAVTSGS